MNETESEQTGVTRRGIVRTVVAGGATVLAPSFVNVVSGDTSSGNVELTTTSTQPTGTSISATVYEDTSGDGSANNQETNSVSAGTDVVTEFGTLTGTETDGYTYWIEFELSTTDATATAELDEPATLALPATTSTPTATPTPTPTPTPGGGTATSTGTGEDPPDEPQSAGELWDNYRAFVTGVVLAFAAIGMWGRSMTVGAFLAYLAFAYIAVETGTVLFTNILYVTIVLVFLGFAFKLWRLEFGGE